MEKKAFAYRSIPKGYDLYEIVDLSNDLSTLKRINIAGLIVVIAMVFLGAINHPLSEIFNQGALSIFIGFVAMLIGLVVYIILHEGAHGIAIKLFTGENATFGHEIKKGLFYAKSDWVFSKVSYIVIALAPVVLWGILIQLLLGDVPETFFWFLYAIQIMNISGAMGDFYVLMRVLKLPKASLCLDNGTSMMFYAKTRIEE